MSESPTLILVEDDLVDSLSIRRELRRHVMECTVVVLTDGQAALDHMQTKLSPEQLRRTVVSLDLSLPGESGFWLLERLQEDPQLRKVPVVVITGSDDEADQSRALQMGARAAFPKSKLTGAVDTLALAVGLLPDARTGATPFVHVAGTGRALVVEDDRADAIQMQRTIETIAGPEWVVDVAHDGEEGIRAVGQRRYDVIFLDVDLPRRSGPQILRELRVRWHRELAPIVAVTGAGSENTVREMFHLGATDYLTKSMFNRASLARILGMIHTKAERSIERLQQQFAEAAPATGPEATSLVLVAGSAGALQMATRAFERQYDLGSSALVYITHASRRPDSSLLSVMQNVNADFEWARPDSRIEAGHLYVTPPGFDIGFSDDRFHVIPADAHPSSVPSLDIAYRLASDVFGNRLSILVLAGLSDDGSAGAARAAAAGARVVVVDPRELGSNGVMGSAVIDAVPSARVISVHDVEGAIEGSLASANGGQ